MDDPHALQRFVDAQDGVYDQACAELRQGRKRSHWMWFIFPQIAGLGSSPMAHRFAIASRAEAAAYLAHPVLGPRLRACAALATAVEGRTARELFCSPAALKFRSSMTLFATVAPDEPVFREALAKFYRGEPDRRTLEILDSEP